MHGAWSFSMVWGLIIHQRSIGGLRCECVLCQVKDLLNLAADEKQAESKKFCREDDMKAYVGQSRPNMNFLQ